MSARGMAALWGALLLWTLGACGSESASPTQADAAAVASSDADLEDLARRPLKEEWRTKPGSGIRRVSVIVLPEDASVYVEGSPQRRRDGVIELIGKEGEAHKLRVVKGSRYLEQEVTIQASGASPSFLDLNAQKAPRAGGGSSGAAAESAGRDGGAPESPLIGAGSSFDAPEDKRPRLPLPPLLPPLLPPPPRPKR